MGKTKQDTLLEAQQLFFGLKPQFSHMPGLVLGATDSAHQVFFGRDGNNVVAVKPYRGKDAADRAEYEMTMLREVAALGFLTLKPVRVEDTKTGLVAFLLTEYVPNLTTMSAVAQRRIGAPLQLRRTAETLGQLHAAGISHGDAQAKNFGIIPTVEDQIAVFDLEKGGSSERGSHHKTDPFTHDLESLVQSLAHKAYGGTNTDMAADQVLGDVIEPYIPMAAQGLGLEKAQEVAVNALNAHVNTNDRLYHPTANL